MQDQKTTDVVESSRTQEFMRLFTLHQRYVYYFIRSLIPKPDEAEEVLQRTNLVLWEKFDGFELGTNFRAWACKIARYEVFNHRAIRNRGEVLFSDALIHDLAEVAVEDAAVLEARTRALEYCREKLRQADREMLDRRYEPGATSQSVAKQLGRPVKSVYKSLSRIRKSLFDCTTKRLAREGQL